jgi:hypothetical protein
MATAALSLRRLPSLFSSVVLAAASCRLLRRGMVGPLDPPEARAGHSPIVATDTPASVAKH